MRIKRVKCLAQGKCLITFNYCFIIGPLYKSRGFLPRLMHSKTEVPISDPFN